MSGVTMGTTTENIDAEYGSAQIVKLLKHIESLSKRISVLEGQTKPPNAKKPTQRRPGLSKKNRPPSANDVSKMLHLKEALRMNVQDFIQDLSLNDLELLDEMYSDGCLTEFEYESIRSRSTDIDKARYLLVKIKDSSPDNIESFLRLLQGKQAYAHLPEKVNESLEEIKNETRSDALCVVCAMKGNVDISDIADHLYGENIISGELYSDIVGQKGNLNCFREYIWTQIIKQIQADSEKGRVVLKTALDNKYKHIGTFLDKLPMNSKLECCCCKRRGLRARLSKDMYGSSTDISSTSTVPRPQSRTDSITEENDTSQATVVHRTTDLDTDVPFTDDELPLDNDRDNYATTKISMGEATNAQAVNDRNEPIPNGDTRACILDVPEEKHVSKPVSAWADNIGSEQLQRKSVNKLNGRYDESPEIPNRLSSKRHEEGEQRPKAIPNAVTVNVREGKTEGFPPNNTPYDKTSRVSAATAQDPEKIKGTSDCPQSTLVYTEPFSNQNQMQQERSESKITEQHPRKQKRRSSKSRSAQSPRRQRNDSTQSSDSGSEAHHQRVSPVTTQELNLIKQASTKVKHHYELQEDELTSLDMPDETSSSVHVHEVFDTSPEGDKTDPLSTKKQQIKPRLVTQRYKDLSQRRNSDALLLRKSKEAFGSAPRLSKIESSENLSIVPRSNSGTRQIIARVTSVRKDPDNTSKGTFTTAEKQHVLTKKGTIEQPNLKDSDNTYSRRPSRRRNRWFIGESESETVTSPDDIDINLSDNPHDRSPNIDQIKSLSIQDQQSKSNTQITYVTSEIGNRKSRLSKSNSLPAGLYKYDASRKRKLPEPSKSRQARSPRRPLQITKDANNSTDKLDKIETEQDTHLTSRALSVKPVNDNISRQINGDNRGMKSNVPQWRSEIHSPKQKSMQKEDPSKNTEDTDNSSVKPNTPLFIPTNPDAYTFNFNQVAPHLQKSDSSSTLAETTQRAPLQRTQSLTRITNARQKYTIPKRGRHKSPMNRYRSPITNTRNAQPPLTENDRSRQHDISH